MELHLEKGPEFVEMGSSGVTMMEGGLSETRGTVVIPDWNGCGLQPLQRTEAAGRFLRCGFVIDQNPLFQLFPICAAQYKSVLGALNRCTVIFFFFSHGKISLGNAE